MLRDLDFSLEHIYTFADSQTVSLTGLGLVLVRGFNRVSGSSNSNGAGKSSLWNGLCWGKFGADLLGRKADEVANRFTKSTCRVVNRLIDDETGQQWTIERTRRPGAVTVSNGKDRYIGAVAEAIIAKRLGYGLHTFKHVMVFGQETLDRFARADQADQLAMLDEIQGLDFSEAQKRAKAWRDPWQKEAERLVSESSILAERVEQLTQQYSQLEASRQQFQQAKQDRLQRLEARLAEAELQLQQSTKTLDRILSDRPRVAKIRQYFDRLAELSQELQTKVLATKQAETERTFASKALVDKQAAVTALLEKDCCPTCRRKIRGDASVQTIQNLFQPDIAEAGNTFQAASKKYTAASKAQGETQAILDRHIKAMPKDMTEAKLRQLEAEVSEKAFQIAEQAKKEAEAQVAQRKSEIQSEQQSRWEQAQAFTNVSAELKKARSDQQSNTKLQVKAQATVQVAQYWVDAFGDRGIRQLLFEPASDFLNDRMQYHLRLLTNNEAQVELSPQTALKGGGVKDRLSINATWQFGAGSYKGGSSGQDRRIDLALFASLQDLAEASCAGPLPFKVWDEPGDFLDSTGKEMFARWVKQEAVKRGTGFIVTHSQELMGLLEPDQVWDVILDETGSHVAVSMVSILPEKKQVKPSKKR